MTVIRHMMSSEKVEVCVQMSLCLPSEWLSLPPLAQIHGASMALQLLVVTLIPLVIISCISLLRNLLILFIGDLFT